MLEEIRTDDKKRKSDRLRLVSNLIRIGADERAAQRIIDELFSTKGVNAARREQIISKIAAGDLRNPDGSLIELLKKAKATGVDVAAALSSRRRKATKQATP
jgi:hypothetical protein